MRRYTGPLVLNSPTNSRNVCSPPRTAGNTTSRTLPSGAASAASATWNKMFSLPPTRLNALMSSSVTFRSARAPIRCTVAISRSTKLSVTSRSRSTSNVTAPADELRARRRRCEGDSTAARNRQFASTFGATSANTPGGNPILRIAISLPISVSIESKLTLPGIALINDKTEPSC